MAGTNTPNLNLYKPNRTDNVSVIADLNDNMDKIDTFAGNVATAESNSKGTVAIVEDGNTCTHVGGIASGQYVVWKGLLYKATQAISVGTTLSTSTNLSAVTDGIANELNGNITTIDTTLSGSNITITGESNISVTLLSTRKASNVVTVSVNVKYTGTTQSGWTTIATVPTGSRPKKTMHFILIDDDSLSAGSGQASEGRVDTSGNMQLYAPQNNHSYWGCAIWICI